MLGNSPNVIRCPPEWLSYVHPTEIAEAIRDINQIDSAVIRRVIESVPGDWASSIPRLSELNGYIEDRRHALEAWFRGGGLL